MPWCPPGNRHALRAAQPETHLDCLPACSARCPGLCTDHQPSQHHAPLLHTRSRAHRHPPQASAAAALLLPTGPVHRQLPLLSFSPPTPTPPTHPIHPGLYTDNYASYGSRMFYHVWDVPIFCCIGGWHLRCNRSARPVCAAQHGCMRVGLLWGSCCLVHVFRPPPPAVPRAARARAAFCYIHGCCTGTGAACRCHRLPAGTMLLYRPSHSRPSVCPAALLRHRRTGRPATRAVPPPPPKSNHLQPALCSVPPALLHFTFNAGALGGLLGALFIHLNVKITQFRHRCIPFRCAALPWFVTDRAQGVGPLALCVAWWRRSCERAHTTPVHCAPRHAGRPGVAWRR